MSLDDRRRARVGMPKIVLFTKIGLGTERGATVQWSDTRGAKQLAKKVAA